MTDRKKVVVGIYGVPGAGKSFLLKMLEKNFKGSQITFHEGSDLIAATTVGGLEAFQKLGEEEKVHQRQIAIDSVAKNHAGGQDVTVIAGHYMFWEEGEEKGAPVMTSNDLKTYTHILYLDVPAVAIAQRRRRDLSRSRSFASLSHLNKWQQIEKADLRRVCYDHGILFSVVSDSPQVSNKFSALLHGLKFTTEALNDELAQVQLDNFVAAKGHQLKTLLILDGDKTLTAIDTGELFWKKAHKYLPSRACEDALRAIFSSNMQYSFTAFRQAMLLYEETFDDDEFNYICKQVASSTTMYPNFVSLLQAATDQTDMGVLVVTCGLRRVWELILEQEGFSGKIEVIGGGRLANGYVVTGGTKTHLVSHAKFYYNAYVCAFGDSPLDLGMLQAADQAIVVVGEEGNRSTSMDVTLFTAITVNHLKAHQVVLPHTAPPRLEPDNLPLIQLTEPKFTSEIARIRPLHAALNFTQATVKSASKLLMTPMRDANLAGPALRESHRRVGHYLAMEYLTSSIVIGMETYNITHVQGHSVTGYRLLHESRTLIIPLMRGGEPMAFGVNDAFPSATFLHAKNPEDIRSEHIQDCLNIVLVDSVVNTGKSVLEFVQHIRHMHATVRIVVVAGVVQSEAVNKFEREICCQVNFRLVALRLSGNKFTGKGGTDTGNRLFNTVHLD